MAVNLAERKVEMMADSMVVHLVVTRAGYLAGYWVVMTADLMVEKRAASSVVTKANGKGYSINEIINVQYN